MKSIITHNQGVCVAIVAVCGLLMWTYGCQSTTKSLTTEVMVTRAELALELDTVVSKLSAELDAMQKQAELRFDELDRQDEIRAKLFEFASIAATTGTFNPVGIITLAGSILGFGAVVDNRIKDKVIKNRPLPTQPTA